MGGEGRGGMDVPLFSVKEEGGYWVKGPGFVRRLNYWSRYPWDGCYCTNECGSKVIPSRAIDLTRSGVTESTLSFPWREFQGVQGGPDLHPKV